MGGWDICWASVGTTRCLFGASDNNDNCCLGQLQPWQLVNHFPNHQELTRKDLLAKNIKRFQRMARKAGTVPLPRIMPSTYVLPQDYALFVEEFRKHGAAATYILKPNSKAQGKGIFLINKLSQVRQKAAVVVGAAADSDIPSIFGSSNGNSSSSSGTGGSAPLRPALENYIAQKYIESPLLLDGKKFDLRLYVLVVSYQPLVVYMSTLGFARLSSTKYTRELAQLDNQLVHLTNVAVQKGSCAYNSSHGNKWSLDNLRLHLEATHGHAAAAQLFADVQQLVVDTLKAVQQVIIQDNHCFELYGFDVIIDSKLQPWLLEVNASPSLTTTTKADRLLKFKVVNDTLSIITPSTWSTNTTDEDTPRFVHPKALGCMQLICDETVH